MKITLFIFSIILAGILLAGCSGGTTSTSTPSTMPTITPPTTSVQTFGTMATAGQKIFAADAAACHGSNGQGVTGPAIIGPGENLSKYQNAKGLLDFISTAMPLNAPGSLSHQEYLQVLAYLLVQNNLVLSTAVFNESTLTNITLK